MTFNKMPLSRRLLERNIHIGQANGKGSTPLNYLITNPSLSDQELRPLYDLIMIGASYLTAMTTLTSPIRTT